ncbi:hypothetical protein PAECIP111893_05221 [Paenibacillus plantiphilus]|uniref:Multiple sugar transport system substrate-binding protein n=1 Tax=Paenibacillus plantiphilus TaxID=2905650 RepID=A0ABM9CWV6_9BACL|nr:extracellular solute-binding protein [Paenibacillus plantiphilus]CAH1225127.1 hypothetical protein PAECIP111893_05221 [Paenibacillus plantiphilus]
MTRKVSAFITAIILALTAILSSCSNDSNEELTKVDPQIVATLKVMHYDEKHFFEQYGNFFTSKFPNVHLEVISTQFLFSVPRDKREAAYNNLIQEKQPDVIMLEERQMEALVQEDALYRLDSVIKRDNFDMDNILPIVTEKLKNAGGGSLYGLAARFSSSAIYYNIDLFNQYNIDPPRDRMTWGELLELAQRFPTSGSETERVYGFANSNTVSNSMANMVFSIGATEGLSYLSKDAKKVTMDTEQWKGIMEKVVKAYKSGAVNTSNEQGPSDLFMKDRIAMRFEGSFYYSQITAQDNKREKPLNWGVVTVPVDPANPNVTHSFQINDLFSINAQSPNKSLAWEFIKFAAGEQVAQALSKTLNGSLSTRPAYVTNKNGEKLDAFYELTESREYKRYDTLPPGFVLDVFIQRALSSVIADEYTLDEAIKTIHDQGNELLNKLYEQQKLEKEEEAAK